MAAELLLFATHNWVSLRKSSQLLGKTMIYRMWRLSEAGPENLGPAFTDDGMLLGRTPLVERRDDRFVVRERGDIERLLRCAYERADLA